MIQGGELDSKSDCGEFDSHPVCQWKGNEMNNLSLRKRSVRNKSPNVIVDECREYISHLDGKISEVERNDPDDSLRAADAYRWIRSRTEQIKANNASRLFLRRARK